MSMNEKFNSLTNYSSESFEVSNDSKLSKNISNNTAWNYDNNYLLKKNELQNLKNPKHISLDQKSHTADLYFNTGISFPISPEEFSDYWSLGFNVGGGVGYSISNMFSLRGLLDYNSFSFDEDTFLKDLGVSGSGVTVDGLSASIFTFTVNAKSFFSSTPGTVAPYTTLGLGYFNLALSDVTVSYQGASQSVDFGSESGFNMIFGGGLDFNVGSIDIFLELDYGASFTKGETTYYLPIKSGVKIGV